jgi:hypothetical protein
MGIVITLLMKVLNYINALHVKVIKLDNGHIQVCFEIDPNDLIKDK